MNSYVIFAFNGNPTCFIHVLLNALDLHEKGYEVKIVLEGEAVTLIRSMEEGGNPLFRKVRDLGLFDGVCKACSAKLSVLEYNENSAIDVIGDMSGHPSFSRYMEKGYTILTL